MKQKWRKQIHNQPRLEVLTSCCDFCPGPVWERRGRTRVTLWQGKGKFYGPGGSRWRGTERGDGGFLSGGVQSPLPCTTLPHATTIKVSSHCGVTVNLLRGCDRKLPGYSHASGLVTKPSVAHHRKSRFPQFLNFQLLVLSWVRLCLIYSNNKKNNSTNH